MPKVVTQFDIELAKWNAKIAQIKADQRAASNAARSSGQDWKAMSKDVKDAFEPLSRGALVKMGGLGVGIYAAQSAVMALIGTVKELSQAEYLSSEQRAQMKVMSDFFTEISQERDRMLAGIAASIGNALSGGALDEYASMEAAGAKKQKTAGLESQLAAAQKERARAAMDDEEKLAAMRAERDQVEARAAKLSGDARLKAQLEIEKKSQEIDQAAAAASKREEERLERLKTLSQQYADAERDVAEAGMNDAQKLVALNEERLRLEQAIAAASSDEEKYKLAIERERVEKSIVESQLRLAAEGERSAAEREERITRLQQSLSEKAFDLLPDEQKLAALQNRLKQLGVQMKGETDEEKRLQLANAALETRQQIQDLTPEKTKVAATPGSVAAAINTIFGRSANELVLDETKRQTQVLERIDKGIQKLAGKEPGFFEEDEVFTF